MQGLFQRPSVAAARRRFKPPVCGIGRAAGLPGAAANARVGDAGRHDNPAPCGQCCEAGRLSAGLWQRAGVRLSPQAGPGATDIVLLGAGHAHVEVLRRAAMRKLPGVRLTLIAREPLTPYSGLLPGLIRGEVTFDDAHIDCAPLAAAAGARLIMAEAVGLDLAGGRVGLAGRAGIGFDLLSIDIGGAPVVPGGGAVGVKPIGRFLERLAAMEVRLRPGARIAVIGAGPGGVELALALASRFFGRGGVVLLGALLPQAPGAVRARVREALIRWDVTCVEGVASGFDGTAVELHDGTRVAAAEAIWATGVGAAGFLAESGLECDAAGCVRVDAGLRSLSHPQVFAAGDCAALASPRPKSGVWAVRAGGILADNLGRAAAGRRLRRWRPQREALVILGLGDRQAVAWRGRWWFSGRLAWAFKDRIDRRWMRKYQGLRPMAGAMRCGGCGAKLGPAALAEALAGVAGEGPGILLGRGDDAAVAVPPAGMAVVQSVDYFRGFVDDPYVFGQISAAHALSDLHAMGARPWTAMAVATLPWRPGRAMQEELRAMMLGAVEVLQADGCALVGGHSAEGAEAGLGFAVTGLADPGRIWRKSGVLPGDAMVLTKPLGTGIVLAGAMRGLARATWLQAAIAGMVRSNAAAAEIFAAHRVRACTDVTGFGLAGHLLEMLTRSGVSAELDMDALPLLPGVVELMALGVESTLAPANSAALELPAHPWRAVLVDPQTSGGLLGAFPADRAEACVAALRAAGMQAQVVARIGDFGEAGLGFGNRASCGATEDG